MILDRPILGFFRSSFHTGLLLLLPTNLTAGAIVEVDWNIVASLGKKQHSSGLPITSRDESCQRAILKSFIDVGYKNVGDTRES